jgi:hypothetical protein
LADLHFRLNERFLYEYEFRDLWQLQVRIERRAAIEAGPSYGVCQATEKRVSGFSSFLKQRSCHFFGG